MGEPSLTFQQMANPSSLERLQTHCHQQINKKKKLIKITKKKVLTSIPGMYQWKYCEMIIMTHECNHVAFNDNLFSCQTRISHPSN